MSFARRYLSLAAALVASGVLLVVPAAGKKAVAAPVSAAIAWPHAQREALAADLADGTAYEPGLFLTAHESVGTAQSKDGKSLRLLLRHRNGSVRLLRSVPIRDNPSFDGLTAVDATTVVWLESGKAGRALWIAGAGPPRKLTTDLGDVRFYQSQYDVVVAEGRIHWVAAAGDDTEVRSIALTGGPVDTAGEPGAWALSAWPWLHNGVAAAAGATLLRNLRTGQDTKVKAADRAVTACSPAWCQSVSFDRDGYPKIEIFRPDGRERRKIADGTAATVIPDAAVLDRFEIFSQITANSELTGNVQLLAYDLTTRSTVEISPDAGQVTYRNGVLAWTTGSQDSFVRHALDLRTV